MLEQFNLKILFFKLLVLIAGIAGINICINIWIVFINFGV